MVRLIAGSAMIVVCLAFGLATTSHPAAAVVLDGVPGYQHVGVLVLENEEESSTWGSSSPATYLNSLRPSGAFAENYYADGHVSLDNYITMTSGQPGNPATDSDCESENLYECQQTVNTAAYGSGANIADQVEGAGLTWKEYADSITTPCQHADLSPTAATDPYQGDESPPGTNYADRHDPFVYYSDITGDATRCANGDVPFTQLATDISDNTVPNYFFITPDTCHDGHDSPCAANSPVPPGCTDAGGLVTFDCWLHAEIPPLLSYLDTHDGVLFITTDEGSETSTGLPGCCTGGPGGGPGFGGQVGLLALGYGVNAGYTSTTDYDHASQLRTVEDALGISTHLNNAGAPGAVAMSDLFAQPSSNTPEAPIVVLLPLTGVFAASAVVRRRRKAA